MSTTPDSSYSVLVQALRQRLTVIGDRDWYARDAAEHLAALTEVSETIVSLSESLPRPLDPRLAHYLQRCSYDKALAFLELGPNAAEDSQRHV